MHIVILVCSIVFLMFSIIKLKWNAFVSLLVTAFLTAAFMGLPVTDIPSTISGGFGSTLGSVGIVIGLGVMLGEFLFESGAMSVIATFFLKKFGDKNSPTAIAATGFIAGIPVFGDVVNVMFGPMCRMLSKRTGISMKSYACALAVSTLITGSLVIPTPAPLTVIDALGVDAGFFFIYSIFVSIIALLPLVPYMRWLEKRDRKNNVVYDLNDVEDTSNVDEGRKLPSVRRSIAMLVIPIALLVVGSFGSLATADGTLSNNIFSFIGNKNVAMLIGALCSALLAKPYLLNGARSIMDNACTKVGGIILITGGGGAYAAVLKATGISDELAASMANLPISLFLLCFLMAQIIRAAQGSATVCLATTASILSTTIAASGLSPILCGLAICCGSIGLSLPNDSGYWATVKFFNISESDAIISRTIPGVIVGLFGLLGVFLLQACANFLPGLYG